MNLTRPRQKLRAMDLTPMIDVVLQLLIFFMFTSQFSQMSRMRMDLPREKGEIEEPLPATIVLDVMADGSVYLDATLAGPERLDRVVAIELENAKREQRPFQVLIRADRVCPASHINALADRLRGVGVDRWKLATAGATQ